MRRRKLAIILAIVIALVIVAPIAYYFIHLEKPIKSSTEELMVSSTDIPSWTRTSTSNWDVGLSLYPGADSATSAGFLNTNGSSLGITIISFKSVGSAANSYPSMGNGATIRFVLNGTEDAYYGWTSTGIILGNDTTNTFYPECMLTFRVQNVVLQMSIRFADPGSASGQVSIPDPWVLELAHVQAQRIYSHS